MNTAEVSNMRARRSEATTGEREFFLHYEHFKLAGPQANLAEAGKSHKWVRLGFVRAVSAHRGPQHRASPEERSDDGRAGRSFKSYPHPRIIVSPWKWQWFFAWHGGRLVFFYFLFLK